MKVDKVVWVKYISELEDLSGYMHPKYKSKQVITACTKRYHNCLYLLMGLSASCRDLMDYLCEQMDSENHVHSNETVRATFIAFVDKVTKSEIQYTQSTVKKAFNILASKGLIIPKSRGTYIVNPEYFFRKGEKDRIEAIKVVLEFKEKKK
jgi:hypothetical protein